MVFLLASALAAAAPAEASPAEASPAEAALDPRGTAPLPEDRIEAQGMAVLGSWAGLNLAGGALGTALAADPGWRAFHLTNAAWNTVNAGIAVAGGISLARRAPGDREERAARAQRLHRVLAINAGLDLGYMAAGAVVWTIGARQDRPALVGTGAALGLQGAWLLGYDLGLRARHRRVVTELALTPVGVRGRF